MAGTATVAVEFTDAGEPAPVDGSVEVSVEREAGLPSPPFALSAIRPGRWQGEVRFTAPGEVTVRVRVTLPSGRTAVFAFPVTVTRRPGG